MEPIRITEVLGYFHEPWYVKWVHRVGLTQANKTAKSAQKIGTRVDELIKSAFTMSQAATPKPTSKDKPEVHMAITAFLKWYEVYQPKSIVPMERLYATIEGQEVTGEPDILVDGVLVDIKCSVKISLSYWVQVNVYHYLKYAIQGGAFMAPSSLKVGILRLDKLTGSYEYVVKDYDAKLVDVWIGLMRAYLYLRGETDDGTEL